MSNAAKLIKYFLLFLMVAMLTACAPANKNQYAAKRKKGSQVNATQLGRNKYYFSAGYQKKLNKNYKKK